MITERDFVEGLFDREGRVYADEHSSPPTDQPTGPGGITLPVLSAWRGRPCTIADLKALTLGEATDVLLAGVRKDLRAYRFDMIGYEPLRLQMLDFSWNSGAERAVRWLQRTIALPPALVTGQMDERTSMKLAGLPGDLLPAINNALAAERAHAAWHGAVKDPELQTGVAKRAISFVVVLA